MKRNHLLLTIVPALTMVVIFVLFLIFKSSDIALLSPKGGIAMEQKNLLILATSLMMIVIIPVFALTFYIPWKFRADNKQTKYRPDWDHNRKLETVWWGIPFVIILVLSIITWQSSHDLDPYKPLQNAKQPVLVQAVALEWKWLFIYPQYNVASVNYLEFPKDTPINFQITADAPMNSLWIPELGGQIYAMAGMTTKLHLIADKYGDFAGSSANLSGEGFADMRFTARSTTQEKFDSWIQSAQSSQSILDAEEYESLTKPSRKIANIQYSVADDDLYNKIIDKYQSHGTSGIAPLPTGGEASHATN